MDHQVIPLVTPMASSPSRRNFIRGTTPEAKITKQRLKPSVTPRTFRRFFAPRSRDDIRKKARNALAEMSSAGVNSRKRPLQSKALPLDEQTPSCSPVSLWEQTNSSPIWQDVDSTPSKRLRISHDDLDLATSLGSDSEQEDSTVILPQPVRRSRFRSSLGDCMRRQLHISAEPGLKIFHSAHSYYDTADYSTGTDDIFVCRDSHASRAVIPFCSAACNTNSLVAVGDEDGVIRLLETSTSSRRRFDQPLLSFRAHNNALLDLQFSQDDKLLATASGDQGCQVIDMLTQKAIFALKGHTSSVKQIKFQPGSNDSVIATSSRDGSIQIWDLRCNTRQDPLDRLLVSLNGDEADRVTTRGDSLRYATRTNLIDDAHYSPLQDIPTQGKNTDRRTQPLQSRSEPSVTALSFLSASNPHILLSGADSQASVKVWDIRMKHSHRRSATPLSTTTLPARHNRYRHFGLTSMAISSDSSRLYTLCKDNTIYVYSTAHLILGSSSELSNPDIKPRRSLPEKTGAGPLYGFRHEGLVASSFYVKLAIRTARDDNVEMLAVGNSNAAPILFPTDERAFNTLKCAPSTISQMSSPRDKWLSLAHNAEVPIYTHGTALIRGHEKEVTNVAWTSEGNLLSLSDDASCRVWRQTPDVARSLRQDGEIEGKRWGHGWADVRDEDWDDSD